MKKRRKNRCKKLNKDVKSDKFCYGKVKKNYTFLGSNREKSNNAMAILKKKKF